MMAELPGDRRHQRRRETDDEPLPEEVVQGWVKWVLLLAKSRAKLAATIGALTFFATTLGWRIIGPNQALQALDQRSYARDSALQVRTVVLEDNQAEMKRSLQEMAAVLKFQIYLQCTNLKRTDPAAVPPECGTYSPPRPTVGVP